MQLSLRKGEKAQIPPFEKEKSGLWMSAVSDGVHDGAPAGAVHRGTT